MALWLMRAGPRGEHESKFLDDNRIYFTWNGLNEKMPVEKGWQAYKDFFHRLCPNKKPNTIRNWAAQGRQFAERMQIGDWVASPSKPPSIIRIGEITGEYEFNPSHANRYYHYRSVKWVVTDIPRDEFDQDLLNSLGANPTVAQIQRNEAEARVKEMLRNRR